MMMENHVKEQNVDCLGLRLVERLGEVDLTGKTDKPVLTRRKLCFKKLHFAIQERCNENTCLPRSLYFLEES